MWQSRVKRFYYFILTSSYQVLNITTISTNFKMTVLFGRRTRPARIVRYLQRYPFRSFSSHQQPQHQDPISKDDKQKGSILEQLKSPPNIITLSRMASTPVLAYWIISEEYKLAIGGCVVAGLSDALDGYLAKNYNMETTVGTSSLPIKTLH